MIEGTWAVVEMLGHRQLIGQLSEITVAGAQMLRVDIPSDPPRQVIVAAGSLYAITPIDEQDARARFARPAELTVGSDLVEEFEWESQP